MLFRSGAATMLSLGLAHFLADFDLDDVTSGYPKPTGEVSGREVEALYKRAAPYAQRVLDMGDLLPHQHTVDAPNDQPAAEKDFPSNVPFRSAIRAELTSYPVNLFKVDLRECTLEISAGEGKTGSAGEAGAPVATSFPVGGDLAPVEGSVRPAGGDSSE